MDDNYTVDLKFTVKIFVKQPMLSYKKHSIYNRLKLLLSLSTFPSLLK